MARLGNPKGLTRVEVVVAILVGLALSVCAPPMFAHLRRYAFRDIVLQ